MLGFNCKDVPWSMHKVDCEDVLTRELGGELNKFAGKEKDQFREFYCINMFQICRRLPV